MKWIIISY